jgi:hypothetical protein
MTSVDVCRLNKFDNPDLVYGRHDGTIIKRLLAAFSFRPTVVATLPVANIFAYNPYSQALRPTVTSIPMINVRPTTGVTTTGAPASNDLSNTLTQQQQFIEGNLIVQRMTNVMYSREILIFYVDRRTLRIGLHLSPFTVNRMPTSVAGFERINDIPVTAPPTIKITGSGASDTFSLASVVCAVTNPAVDPKEIGNYVIGSKTYLYNNDNNTLHCYNPAKSNTSYVGESSISDILTSDTSAMAEAEQDMQMKGLIYIYQNKSETADKALSALFM